MPKLIQRNGARILLVLSAILLMLRLEAHSRAFAMPLTASSAANYAGTASNTVWTNASNATGSPDGVCANAPFAASPIDLTNFSFNIPPGSIIRGIVLDSKSDYGLTAQASALLLKAGSPVGNTQTWTPPNFTSTCASSFSTVGGTGDLWGANWTPSDINTASFGVRITNSNAPTSMELDAVRITVYYDPPATPVPPSEVPEADTLLLMSGGLGGLAIWLTWQRRRFVERTKTR